MKVVAFIWLLAICAIECRKVVPINKNANIDFINMESGGGARPSNVPVLPPGPPAPSPAKPQTPTLSHPEPPKTGPSLQPKSPVPAVTTTKPVPVAVPSPSKPVQPQPVQPKPVQPVPNQMDLKPVPAKPSPAGGVTTPGYGNVKQLVTFYDSQGKASVIRPYSYSQAVKQG